MVSGGGGKLLGRETEVQNGGWAWSVPTGSVFLMTAGGGSYALRIVRGHRLWERCLTDRTSAKAAGWHDVAKRCGRSLTSNGALANPPRWFGFRRPARALLTPFGLFLGLTGVILLAYIVAIPANEIVIPTVLMLTVVSLGTAGAGEGAGVMFELESAAAMGNLLKADGWTLLTGVNIMLFSLLHNPCSTTIYTIYKETRSAKWTTVATLMPLVMGFVVCFLVGAQIWRLAA